MRERPPTRKDGSSGRRFGNQKNQTQTKKTKSVIGKHPAPHPSFFSWLWAPLWGQSQHRLTSQNCFDAMKPSVLATILLHSKQAAQTCSMHVALPKQKISTLRILGQVAARETLPAPKPNPNHKQAPGEQSKSISDNITKTGRQKIIHQQKTQQPKKLSESKIISSKTFRLQKNIRQNNISPQTSKPKRSQLHCE